MAEKRLFQAIVGVDIVKMKEICEKERNEININSTKSNGKGWTFLMAAVRSGNVDILNYILIEFADSLFVDMRDSIDGSTALHTACYRNNFQMVYSLVSLGRANLNIINTYGETPLFDAVKNENFEIASFLLQNGAFTSVVNKERKLPFQESGISLKMKLLLTNFLVKIPYNWPSLGLCDVGFVYND